MAFAEAGLHGCAVHAVIAWESVPMDHLPLQDDEAGMRAAAKARLDQLMIPLRELHPGLDAHAEVVTGPPPEVLMDASSDARLLVVGSRGRAASATCCSDRSVTRWVRHAPCPGLVE